jgi:alpha-L-arabinofuranosidase
MSTNYARITSTIVTVEQGRDTDIKEAYRLVNVALMGGDKVADLARETGVHKTTMGYYALGAQAWFISGVTHDVTARDFRQALITACKIAGVKTIRADIEEESAKDAPRLGALVDTWKTYEKKQKSNDKTALEQILALLPECSQDDLATLWDTLAGMASEQSLELTNA